MAYHGAKGALAPPQSVPHIRDITGTAAGSGLPLLANSLVLGKSYFCPFCIFVAFRYHKIFQPLSGRLPSRQRVVPAP